MKSEKKRTMQNHQHRLIFVIAHDLHSPSTEHCCNQDPELNTSSIHFTTKRFNYSGHGQRQQQVSL